ncbi:MAG: sarcosine oxidase subunit gamma [Paracoccaceae bacterium]|nr:sarcosine oxidase subunit gamma [Paracoccaceae bacterium]
MAEIDFTLEAAPILGGVDLTIGANRIAECDDLAIVSVATPLGGDDAMAKALKDVWNLSLPEPSVSSQSGEIRTVRTAPDQLFLIFPHATPDAETVVQQKLAGAGYTTDQTDVWVVLEISGPDTLAALERICPLDTAAFPIGGAARTVMEHMGALLLRLDVDRFWLLSASSSAGSFLHAVETSYRNVASH